MCNQTVLIDHQASDEDKYTKLRTTRSSARLFNNGKIHTDVVMYVLLVIASLLFISQGTASFGLSWELISIQWEILGLFLLRKNIKSRESVSSISGMTCLMQTFVYFTRFASDLTYGSFQMGNSAFWLVFLEMCTFLLVLDILRSIFITHRSTYQAELDVMKAWYIVTACLLMPLVAHMHMPSWTLLQNYAFTFTLYLDALALMPQVVMMVKSGGTVEVPVLNFVAAIGIARSGDLFNTISIRMISSDMSNFHCLRLWMAGMLNDEAGLLVHSFLVALCAQIVQLILIADFLHQYFRARTWKSKATDKINIVEFLDV